jgi:hypothetical protein
MSFEEPTDKEDENEENVTFSSSPKVIDQTFSSRCKVCNLPKDIQDGISVDFKNGYSYVDLCTKWNDVLKEKHLEAVLMPMNIYSHFKNHSNLQITQTTETKSYLEEQIFKGLAITDTSEGGKWNGKDIITIVDEGDTDIKPLSKGLLKSKTLRLKKLYEQLAHDESISGGQQNIKLHREITALEETMFKIVATLHREVYLDSEGKYDKSLYIIQELARKIFVALKEKELQWNGFPEKLTAMNEITTVLAELFDNYEKEIDTIKPE